MSGCTGAFNVEIEDIPGIPEEQGPAVRGARCAESNLQPPDGAGLAAVEAQGTVRVRLDEISKDWSINMFGMLVMLVLVVFVIVLTFRVGIIEEKVFGLLEGEYQRTAGCIEAPSDTPDEPMDYHRPARLPVAEAVDGAEMSEMDPVWEVEAPKC
jgi:hypothetical protein